MHLYPYSASSVIAEPDSQCFLFTLVNPSGSGPLKITPKPGGGIRSHSDWGPSFGNERLNDFVAGIPSSLGRFIGGLELGYGLWCPQDAEKQTYFTGSGTFAVNEMEVFQIDF